jgi:hypothetical protein
MMRGKGACFRAKRSRFQGIYHLDAMQKPLTLECKTGFAIHHALDQFHSGHLSFQYWLLGSSVQKHTL